MSGILRHQGFGAVLLFCSPLVVALAIACLWLHLERKRSWMPIELKLLRGPGETLRHKIAKRDEDFPLVLLFGSLLVLILPFCGLQFGLLAFPDNPIVGLSVATAVFLLCKPPDSIPSYHDPRSAQKPMEGKGSQTRLILTPLVAAPFFLTEF